MSYCLATLSHHYLKGLLYFWVAKKVPRTMRSNNRNYNSQKGYEPAAFNHMNEGILALLLLPFVLVYSLIKWLYKLVFNIIMRFK